MKLINEEESILYQLELRNFWDLRKMIRVEFANHEINDTLPYTYRKGILLLRIPKKLIDTVDNKATIKVYINNKLMWIKHSEEFVYHNETVLTKGNYYVTTIRKNIILRNQFSQFEFKSDKLYSFHIKRTIIHYNLN